MNLQKTLTAFFFAFLLYQPFTEGSTLSSDQEEPAIVYFFRLPNYAGSAVKMTIMSNDQPVVRLRNASYFKYTAQPGNYVFSISYGSGSNISLSLESGKEYYIKCYYNMGFWSGIPILELMDSEAGKATLAGNKLSEQPVEQIIISERKSRLGVVMTGGFGFESTAWFIDENGDDVKLSPGGGFGIGAEFGHQFSKSFDLSFNLFFQGSSLSKTLKNASASFNRLGITATPAIVIPVKGGENLRFRIGAGPGLYSLGTMKIDASKISGSKLTLKYNTAIGLHGLLLFETNFSERGAMNFGIRYSNIHYKFNPTGSSVSVTESKLRNPDGSGIDFFLGYYFVF